MHLPQNALLRALVLLPWLPLAMARGETDIRRIPAAYAPVLQESQARVAAIAGKLEEQRARRDALAREQAGVEKEMRALAKSLGLESADAFRNLAARETALTAETRRLEAARTAVPPGPFGSLDRMLEFDRLTDALAAAQESARALAREHRAVLHTRLNETPAGKALVDTWTRLEHDRIAADNEKVILQEERDSVSRSQGNLQKKLLPPVEAVQTEERRTIRIRPPPPADAAARRARFEARGQPESLAATADAFFRGIDTRHPGLEPVAALLQAGRKAEALDAYRDFFLARLLAAEPEVVTSGGEDPDGVEGDVTDVDAAFSPPTEAAVRDALAGVVRESISLPGNTATVEAELGAPGAIPWAFLTAGAAAETPDGPLLLEFSRKLAIPGITGAALLHSYALGGPKEHLARWVEVLDDWTLHWRRDAELSPLTLRDYNPLHVYRLKEALLRMRYVARMRPEFIRDLPSATLARWLTAMNEEYVTAAIRLGRSGLYNFRIMALGGMIPLSLGMPEFHLHQWALREAWRQVDDNFIYKTRRDGANFEFANDGHENTDQALINPYLRLRAWNPQPDWTEPFWGGEFLDNFLANTRYWVHNLKQDGYSYRLNARSQRARYLGANPEYKIQLLADEDELRRRVWKVHGAGRPEEEPRVFSETMAFQGYSYLRSGWEPRDYFLYFQSIGQPILSGREDNTGFSLYGHGAPLLLTPAPAVDGRVQDIHHGLVYKPGGKANFATYGRPDAVKTGRFHAGARFDLTEGGHSGVYSLHRGDTFLDVFGSHGLESARAKAMAKAEREGRPFVDEPIRDTRQDRQILSVRGRELYIVTDRVTSEAERRVTQFHTVYTPVRLDRLGERMALLRDGRVEPLTADATARVLRTRNPGLANLELRHFSAFPVEYRVKEGSRSGLEAAAKGDLPGLTKTMSKRDRHHTEQSGTAMLSRQVSVEWSGRGARTLVTLVLPQGRTYTPAPPEALADARDLSSSPEAAGFSGTLRDGTPVVYQAAFQPARLRAGALEGTASALLLVGETGVAQDCRDLTLAGRPVEGLPPDFTFRLENGRLVVEDVIHRPIQPVVISPGGNVFTESLPVRFSCATPGVEIRYTLDGSRPTPASALYSGPVVLRETTRVKARAFRPGVTADVWTQDGTHATVVYSAVFRREAPAAPVEAATRPGLRTEYFEGLWTELMARSLTQPALATGVARQVPDASLRRTDRAFGVRHDGFIEVPEDGVYTFHAPAEFIYPDVESGYDLRVFVNGREWIPAVRWHGHGTWSVALKKGRHALRVVFVDLRPRPHKIEMMWGFPHPDFTWKGVVPELKVSGPGFGPRAIPGEWLSHVP